MDTEQAISVYTDAITKHWAAVVTHYDPSGISIPLYERRQTLLVFLAKTFTPTQRNWNTFEQEAFSIFMSFEKLDYLFAYEKSSTPLLTTEICFGFKPASANTDSRKTFVNRVQLLALFQ